MPFSADFKFSSILFIIEGLDCLTIKYIMILNITEQFSPSTDKK